MLTYDQPLPTLGATSFGGYHTISHLALGDIPDESRFPTTAHPGSELFLVWIKNGNRPLPVIPGLMDGVIHIG